MGSCDSISTVEFLQQSSSPQCYLL
uniref:Uncharacterized protein n=1 Tax=Rhizophora mucronata TaxID=61149 RepID=A0A2P2PWH2_RHIMU